MAALNTQLQQVTSNTFDKKDDFPKEFPKDPSTPAPVAPGAFPPFMPPPGMFPFPGMPPPSFGMPPFPFAMPPFNMPPFNPTLGNSILDDPKYFYSEELKRDVRESEQKILKCKEECAIYTEHDTPDGKKYYFNTKLNQSIWDKPKCMLELTELEQQLNELKKRRVEKQKFDSNSSNIFSQNSLPNLKDKEKENELSEDEKQKLKSKPISSTAVPGTPWCIVWTRDKRVFFYNPSEKVSLWERPSILIGRIDVDQMLKEEPPSVLTETKKKPIDQQNEPPIKRNKLVLDEDESTNDSAASVSMSPSRVAPDEFLQKQKIEASKEAAIEAEHKAAQVRAQLPFEQRVSQFRELLVEKDISAYSTWEKELQKIVFDPRYLLLASKERKQVFDKYVRDRANEESKERAEKLKRKRDDFKEVLKEAKIDLKQPISFSEFSAKFAKDERFKSIEKTKDRESLFNDYLSDLRKQDKEDKYAEKEKHKKGFIQLLKEIKNLHRGSSWTETKKMIETEPRYRAVESGSRREDYFRDYCKYLDDEAMEQGETDEDEGEKRREKEKQERVEASLRERNKQVKEQLSKYQSEREKERESLKKDEAVESFRALLIDLVKPVESDLGWKEARKILKKDSRWSFAKALDKEKKEELFNEHMSKFKAKKRDLFFQLLDETEGILLKGTSWKEAKKLIKSDARYEKLAILESFKMEREFESYLGERFAKAVNDLKELLMQAKMIGHKSFDLIKENASHMKEIEDFVGKDKSWIVLECAQEERKQILMEYIERLKREGLSTASHCH